MTDNRDKAGGKDYTGSIPVKPALCSRDMMFMDEQNTFHTLLKRSSAVQTDPVNKTLGERTTDDAGNHSSYKTNCAC